jgi:hypothetical protein
MNTQSNAMPEPALHTQAIAPAAISPTRVFYWSARRELWEHRYLYLAPLGSGSSGLWVLLVPSSVRRANPVDSRLRPPTRCSRPTL